MENNTTEKTPASNDPLWYENFFVVEGLIFIFSSICLIAYSQLAPKDNAPPDMYLIFLKELGFAGIVAFILNISIEWVNRRRHEKFTHALNRNIFKTVYGRNIDKKIIDQIEKNILKCDVYRKNYLIEIRLDICKTDPSKLKFHFFNSYDAINIGPKKSRIHILKAEIDLENPDSDKLEKVEIDGKIQDINKISTQSNGLMHISIEADIEPNHQTRVCVTYVKNLPIQSSEAIITTFPMDGMKLTVSDPNETFEVGAISLHPEDANFENENNSRNDHKKWSLDCGITPGQGMLLHWKPKISTALTTPILPITSEPAINESCKKVPSQAVE
jgi:hypothetical protein